MGRTVFVSSHLMSEMAQTATRLVILGRGRLIAETSVEDFIGRAAVGDVLVRTPEAGLGHVLAGPGITVSSDGTDVLRYPAPRRADRDGGVAGARTGVRAHARQGVTRGGIHAGHTGQR